MAGSADVIAQSLQDAGLADMNDNGELIGTEGETSAVPEEVSGESTEGGEPQEAAAATTETPAVTPEQQVAEDELDRELQALGIQSKDARGGETRIRYTRVRRIWENYKKKYADELAAGHKKEIEDRDGRLTKAEQRTAIMDRIDRALADPSGEGTRQYLLALAASRPYIRQILSKPLFEAAAQAAAQGGNAQPAPENDPMPQPDAQYADGTKGYSLEGLQKRDEWVQRQTTRRIMAEVDKKYGSPIQQFTQQQRQSAERNMAQQRVQGNVNQAKEVYGQLFTDDFGEIGSVKNDSKVMAYLREHPQTDFLTACARVLIPKMKADRTTMREELLTELNKRPSAAKSSAPAPTNTSAAEESDANNQNIIMAELRKAGMV